MSAGAAADLHSPSFFENPYPLLAALRASEPVCWSDRANAYVVTRYDDCTAILNDAEHFADTAEDGSPLIGRTTPEHIRFRHLLNRALTADFVAELEPAISRTIDGLLDTLAVGQSVDLIAQVAYPLATRILADVLGIPDSDRGVFETWASDISASLAGADTDERNRQATAELVAYFGYRLALQDNNSSLLGRLVAAGMPASNILSLCHLLMVAARELVVGLLGNSACALLTHPDQLERLRADVSLLDNAIDESLRWDAPVLAQARVSSTGVNLRGTPVAAGSTLLVMLGAANRDPHVFYDPDRFEIARPNAAHHLSFGRGIHYCPGAPIARLELRLLLRTLLDRFVDIRLIVDRPPQRRRAGRLLNLRSFASLPVQVNRG